MFKYIENILPRWMMGKILMTLLIKRFDEYLRIKKFTVCNF